MDLLNIDLESSRFNQYAHLIDHAAAMLCELSETTALPITQDHIDALDTGATVLRLLDENGIGRLGTLDDLLHATATMKRALSKDPVRKDGVWHCPECNARVNRGHSYCKKCGRRLIWREAVQ